jgi:hypothetical protein
VRRLLVGSDAEVVLREANVPLLLVRSPEHAVPRSRGKAATAKR